MARQLTLIDTPPSWRLDEATKAAGRKGIAEARATLRAALATQSAPTAAAPAARRTAACPPPGPRLRRDHPATVEPMGIVAWCIVGLLAGGLARRAVGAPKRGCLGTIAIGVLGALVAGFVWRAVTGTPLDTFDELDLGSIFVAFLGAAGLLLLLEALGGGPSGRRRR